MIAAVFEAKDFNEIKKLNFIIMSGFPLSPKLEGIAFLSLS